GTLRWRWAVLAVAVLALAGSYMLTRDLGTEFLPSVDDGIVTINMNLPPGTSAEETNRVALAIENLVREMPDVEHIFTAAGGFLFGGSTSERAGRGNIEVQLSPPSVRSMTADQWGRTSQPKSDEHGFRGPRSFAEPRPRRGPRGC